MAKKNYDKMTYDELLAQRDKLNQDIDRYSSKKNGYINESKKIKDRNNVRFDPVVANIVEGAKDVHLRDTQKLDDLSSKIGKVESKIESKKDELAAVEHAIEKAEKSLEGYEQKKIDSMSLDEVKDEIKKFNAELKDIEKRIKIPPQISVEQLDEVKKQLTAEMEKIYDKLEPLYTRQNDLNRQINDIEAQIKSDKQELRSLPVREKNLEKLIKNEVASLAREEAIRKPMTEAQRSGMDSLDGYRLKIAEMRKQLHEEIPQKKDDLTKRIEENTKKVDELKHGR